MAWTLKGGDRNEISRRRTGVARTLKGRDRGDLTNTDRQVALHKKYLQTGWIGRVEIAPRGCILLLLNLSEPPARLLTNFCFRTRYAFHPQLTVAIVVMKIVRRTLSRRDIVSLRKSPIRE